MSLGVRAAASVVLAVLAVPTGCAADVPTGRGANATSAVPSPAAPNSSPALTFAHASTGVSCLETGGRAADLGYWGTTMTASTPLTITGVRASGTGHIRVRGGIVAPVLGRLPHVTGISDWPPPPPTRLLRRSIVWKDRTSLVGAHLDVQRAVLPFLHLRARPGTTLGSVEVSYRTDDGQTGAATEDLPTRFSRGRC